MPLFQSRTARVSVLQNGIELQGVQHNPNSGFIIRCKPGAITIWIRNLTNTPYLASLNVGRPVTVGAGLDYSFDLEVGTDGASCLLRWTEIRCAELFFEIS